MMKLSDRFERGDVFAQKCPSRDVLRNVTSRWGVLTLVALRGGTLRFSELRRKISGISEKMLSQTLHTLQQDGFIQRIAYPVIPPHVEYSLTTLGLEVSHHVELLADWIEQSLPVILKARTQSEADGIAKH
jgi:DNA-binding HxlR family transcriptional regulator